MRLFNGFCAHLQGERCMRGTKWIGMSKTKLPLSNISSAFCASALFTFVVIYPASIFLSHSPDPPPVWRAVGGTSSLIKRRSSKPQCESRAPSSLFEQDSSSPALMLTGLWAIGDYIMESTHNAFWVLCRGTNDSRIRCVWSPGSISRCLWWLKRVSEGHIYVWIHTMVAPLPESSYMAWKVRFFC